MDPLSALSLAVNVAQCIDWARQIVCKAKELHSSVSGTSREVSEQETVTLRLKELVRDITAARGRINPKVQSSALQRICGNCMDASNELLHRLQGLKIPRNTVEHRRWKSFRQALKTVWSKNEIDAMASRLLLLRHELNTELIVITRQVVQLNHKIL